MKTTLNIFLIFAIFAILLFQFPSQTFAANCTFTYSPAPLSQNMGSLGITVESKELKDGEYWLFFNKPGDYSDPRKIRLTTSGTTETFNKPGLGWQPGNYNLYLRDIKKEGESTVGYDCKTSFILKELVEQKSCFLKPTNTSYAFGDDVKIVATGITTGTYDIYINGKYIKAENFSSGNPVSVGAQNSGKYNVDLKSRCGILGINCAPVVGASPRTQCGPATFSVKTRDGEEPKGQETTEGMDIANKLSTGCNGKYVNSDNVINTAIGCIPIGDPSKTIGWFLSWFIGISGGIAFLLIVYGAIQMMTASGDPQKLQGGREVLTAAISGLIFIIFSVFLLNLIGVKILQLPGF